MIWCSTKHTIWSSSTVDHRLQRNMSSVSLPSTLPRSPDSTGYEEFEPSAQIIHSGTTHNNHAHTATTTTTTSNSTPTRPRTYNSDDSVPVSITQSNSLSDSTQCAASSTVTSSNLVSSSTTNNNSSNPALTTGEASQSIGDTGAEVNSNSQAPSDNPGSRVDKEATVQANATSDDKPLDEIDFGKPVITGLALSSD